MARTANARPPSVLLLSRGHIKFRLQKRVDLLRVSEFLISRSFIYSGVLPFSLLKVRARRFTYDSAQKGTHFKVLNKPTEGAVLLASRIILASRF